jgi:hypothetical protein
MFILTCALLASAVLLRRMPLMALAVTLAGLAATSLGPKTEVPASALQVVVACAAGLKIGLAPAAGLPRSRLFTFRSA